VFFLALDRFIRKKKVVVNEMLDKNDLYFCEIFDFK